MCFAGLFLHVGYSVVERYVIERNSNLRLDSKVMLHKLTALLHDPLTSHKNQVSEQGGRFTDRTHGIVASVYTGSFLHP